MSNFTDLFNTIFDLILRIVDLAIDLCFANFSLLYRVTKPSRDLLQNFDFHWRSLLVGYESLSLAYQGNTLKK